MTLFDPEATEPPGPATTAPPIEGGADRARASEDTAGAPEASEGTVAASAVPEGTAAASAVPEGTAAASAVPEGTAAASAVPEGTAAASAVPEGTAAASAVPEGTAAASAVPEGTVRLRLDVAYDGTGFRGFAAQRGQRTVAGVLAEAIATVVRHPVTLTCAGRTDAGVHAQAQVVHVDVASATDVARLVRSVNALTGPEIAVRAARPVDSSFDARHHAASRTYRYLVHEADVADPWWRDRVWTVAGPLDLRAMAAGADALLGEHDVRALCRRPPGTTAEDPIVRRVLDARWSQVDRDAAMVRWGRLLRFDVTATAFCHQMVRSAVGLLVAVGQGRRRAADVHWALQRGDRSAMPDPAPPGGLTLVDVEYRSDGA